MKEQRSINRKRERILHGRVADLPLDPVERCLEGGVSRPQVYSFVGNLDVSYA